MKKIEVATTYQELIRFKKSIDSSLCDEEKEKLSKLIDQVGKLVTKNIELNRENFGLHTTINNLRKRLDSKERDLKWPK